MFFNNIMSFQKLKNNFSFDGVITINNNLNISGTVDGRNISLDGSVLDSHIINLSNPHSVSKAQIGLPNIIDIKSNYSASLPPTVFDDISNNYATGSRWIDTTNNNEYICIDPSIGVAQWFLTTNVGDVIGPSSSTDNSIVRFDSTSGKLIKNSISTIDDDGKISSINSKNGFMLNIQNTKTDGGGSGLNLCAGELLGDVVLHIGDANNTFNILEIESDQGYVTFGKTYAQSLLDNGVVHGLDLQHDSGTAKDFNTQNGVYRIGGIDVVDVVQTLTNKTLDSTTNLITADKLHSATTTIDVSSTTPSTGQILMTTSPTSATWQSPSSLFFGGEFQSEELTTISSTSSTSYIQRQRMTTPNLPNGTYRISFLTLHRASSTRVTNFVRIQINDSTTLFNGQDFGKETKDNNSVQREHYNGFDFYTGSGVLNIDIDFKKNGSGTAYINYSRLSIWRIN